MTEPLDGETPSVSAIAPLCVLLPPHASDALHAEAQQWAEHLGLSLVNLEEVILAVIVVLQLKMLKLKVDPKAAFNHIE